MTRLDWRRRAALLLPPTRLSTYHRGYLRHPSELPTPVLTRQYLATQRALARCSPCALPPLFFFSFILPIGDGGGRQTEE